MFHKLKLMSKLLHQLYQKKDTNNLSVVDEHKKIYIHFVLVVDF